MCSVPSAPVCGSDITRCYVPALTSAMVDCSPDVSRIASSTLRYLLSRDDRNERCLIFATDLFRRSTSSRVHVAGIFLLSVNFFFFAF